MSPPLFFPGRRGVERRYRMHGMHAFWEKKIYLLPNSNRTHVYGNGAASTTECVVG